MEILNEISNTTYLKASNTHIPDSLEDAISFIKKHFFFPPIFIFLNERLYDLHCKFSEELKNKVQYVILPTLR